MSQQIAVRFPDELLAELDWLVVRVGLASRADAVRMAVEALVRAEQQRAEAEAIVAGYERLPQTDDEVAVARAAALRSIREEPW
jgi:metal-responsive CopG/Arc/MetJ family transcriptional regulator